MVATKPSPSDQHQLSDEELSLSEHLPVDDEEMMATISDYMINQLAAVDATASSLLSEGSDNSGSAAEVQPDDFVNSNVHNDDHDDDVMGAIADTTDTAVEPDHDHDSHDSDNHDPVSHDHDSHDPDNHDQQ